MMFRPLFLLLPLLAACPSPVDLPPSSTDEDADADANADADADAEHRIAAAFYFRESDDTRAIFGGISAFGEADRLDPDLSSADLAAAINARLATLATTPGSDVTFAAFRGGEVALDSDGLHLRVDADADAPLMGVLVLKMHASTWERLGFNLDEQGQVFEFGQVLTSEYEISVLSPEWDDGFHVGAVHADDPGPGYVTGYFNTCAVGLPCNATGARDNGGKVRTYRSGGAL